MKQNLEHAHRVPGDLGPRQVLEERLPHLVGNLGFGKFPLGFTHRADLRQGIDTRRHIRYQPEIVVLHDVGGCRAALVIGGAGEAWPANHITGCVDILHLGSIMIVNRQLTTTVRSQTDVFQAQFFGIAATTIAPEERICPDFLAGLQ